VIEPERRPKVLQLVTRLNIGGPARQVLSLTSSLNKQLDMVVAAGQSPAVEGLIQDSAVPVRDVPLIRPVRPHIDAAATRAVRRLLVAEVPDILHTHMAKAGAVGRGVARTLRDRPRTVHTFHGHVLGGYFSPPVQSAFICAERALARHTDRLVAVSEEIRSQLVDLRIGHPDQYEVIPVGIDVDAYVAGSRETGRLRSALGISPEVPLVGVVARLAPIKDHATLLHAIAELDGAHLAILGDGELRLNLEHQAKQLGIRDRVHFTGWWDDMTGAYADVDVVALTSLNEGTPVTLVEAAAAGRASVATTVGGVPSVVTNGETGVLVSPRRADEVAAALDSLLSDEHLRARMGSAARNHVKSRFSATATEEAHRRLYRELHVS
jgi:glycosyltransferase involved in cell wall biosynthesis